MSGSMKITGNKGDQVRNEGFQYWYGPNGQWRIESGGEFVYTSSADGDALVRIDNQMQRRGGTHGSAHLR